MATISFESLLVPLACRGNGVKSLNGVLPMMYCLMQRPLAIWRRSTLGVALLHFWMRPIVHNTRNFLVFCCDVEYGTCFIGCQERSDSSSGRPRHPYCGSPRCHGGSSSICLGDDKVGKPLSRWGWAYCCDNTWLVIK